MVSIILTFLVIEVVELVENEGAASYLKDAISG